MRWCIPALISYSLVQIYSAVLTAAARIRALCYITLIAVLINAILNVSLIPHWGAKGTCIAALSSQGFCGIATLLYARRKLGTPIHWQSLLTYLFVSLSICAFLWFATKNIGPRWAIIGGACCLALVLIWITKLVDLRNWRSVFR
jgi:O-antigen/teichoic acid export membrane protein